MYARRSGAVSPAGRRIAAVDALHQVRGNRGRHGEMDAEQSRRRLARQCVGDDRAVIATLRHVTGVAQALHEHVPGPRHAVGIPAEIGRLAREAIAGDGGDHDVEGVLRAPAVGDGIGERAYHLQELQRRAGPAVGEDQR